MASKTRPGEVPTPMTTLIVNGDEFPLLEIRSTGDIILDVHFKNTSECTKSIPKDALRNLRARKLPVPSPRILYRVRLDTLKKHSEYFAMLLKPQFAEGLAVAEALKKIEAAKQNPSEIEAEKLPRISIVDEDVATKTFGRETIFRDMLRIIHGAEYLTAPFNTQCLTVLVLMADRYHVNDTVTRHIQKTLANHKYPVTLDKNGEEILRQKILIQFYTDQRLRFTGSTRELMLRGSIRWGGGFDDTNEYQTPWWDLPSDLEAELSYRRSCLLKTIASIQSQFLAIYSSKDRQCKLGYDSSSACDSFQLGEMVKFLTRKGLLSLVPFQAVSPDDADYIWPEAYTGDIDYLIGVLRQCPSYQIDKHHSHCGLRTKLLPALDYIKTCIDTGLGVKLSKGKNGPVYDSWIPIAPAPSKKAFYVSNDNGEDVDVAGEAPTGFNFVAAKPNMLFGGSSRGAEVERSPKGLFTAEKWNWVTEPDTSMPRTTPNLGR